MKRDGQPNRCFFRSARIEDLSNLYFTGHMESVRESGAMVRETSGQPA
jgi:hypothetical protein